MERGGRAPKLQTPIGVESATWRFLEESEEFVESGLLLE